MLLMKSDFSSITFFWAMSIFWDIPLQSFWIALCRSLKYAQDLDILATNFAVGKMRIHFIHQKLILDSLLSFHFSMLETDTILYKLDWIQLEIDGENPFLALKCCGLISKCGKYWQPLTHAFETGQFTPYRAQQS